MIKKILTLFLALSFAFPLVAAAQLNTTQGGTGTTSPSGILYGTTGVLRLGTVGIGAGLQFVAGVLSTIGTAFSYPFPGNATTTQITFSNGIIGNVTGNASTATALQNARTINGTSFNGTSNIVITAASSTLLGDANTYSALQTFSTAPTFSTLTGVLKGNGSSPVSVGVNGTDFSLITAKTCNSGDFLSAVTAPGVFSCNTPTGTTYTGTYPIQVTGSVISLAFGTTTSNTWANTQTFANSPVFSTLGAGTVNSTSAGTLYNTGTSTPTVTAPIAYSGTLGQFIGGVSGAFTCIAASGSVAGCLSSTDWNTFNGKQAAGNYITALTGDVTAAGPGSVAATLATVNSNVGSFTNANITVNAKGLITAASSGSGSGGITTLGPAGQGQTGATQTLATSTTGTDFTITASGDIQTFNLPTASASNRGALSTTDWSTFNSKQAAISTTWPITLSGATLGFNGLSTSTPAVVGNIPYFSDVNKFANVATSAIAVSSSFGYTGTLGAFVGGTGGTLSIANAGISNAMLANSTISGIALGASLGDLTAGNGSLTFSATYNGSAARNIVLNTANTNTWSVLQNFSLASTSQLSVFNNAYFGATATSTFTSTGALGIASSTPWGLLSVNPNGISGPSFVVGSSTLTHFIIKNDGKVGIGTTSPTTLLQLFSTGTTTQSLDSNAASKGGCIEIKDRDGVGYTYLTANNGQVFTSQTSCK